MTSCLSPLLVGMRGSCLGALFCCFLLKHPKRIEDNNPDIALVMEEYLHFFEVLKQLVV